MNAFMIYCPNCGSRINEADVICEKCGFNVARLKASLAPIEESIKATIIERIEGIKLRDAEKIQKIIDKDHYTKFDDWPPFERQGVDGLKREAEALKVLKEYDYKVDDWRIDLLSDNIALATFIIRYHGRIRNLNFNVKSRVTMVLFRREEGWRLIHEHWSRIPENGGFWRRRLL